MTASASAPLRAVRFHADLSWTLGLSGRPGKDEREQQFFVGLFGDTVIPFKRSYFFLVPIEAGVERRLFRAQIRSTFRPFLHAAAGPAIGYQWPYFDDLNGDGLNNDRPDDGDPDTDEATPGALALLGDGEFRLGVSASLGFGAYIDTSARSALGFRFGYAAAHFFREVELLEPDPRVDDPSRRFFSTPTLGVQFVRRF